MADQEQPVTEGNLEQMTNQVFGDEQPQPQESTAQDAPPTEEAATPAEAPQSGQVDMNESLKTILKETPFNGDDIVDNVKKFVEAHKNLQSEWTKKTTEIKPYDPLLKFMSADPKFAQAVEQLRTIYQNPQLANAYINPQGQVLNSRPNPLNYDLMTPDGIAKYDQDLTAFMERNVDSRLNTRLADLEQRTKLENFKLDFARRFPQVKDNAEELLGWAQEQIMNMNPIEAAYKLKNWDAIQTTALAEAKKTVTSKIEEAGKTKTPSGSGAGKPAANIADIVEHIGRYGIESAEKRYGEKEAVKAMEEFTNNL